MAKQTLKSLLGSSDDRVEVNYKLNQPTLSPSGVRGGQYQVAVQQTGQSQAAMLAKNLSQFSSTLKQFSDAQEQIGVQQAAGVTDEDLYAELKKEDPDSFFALKRRKSYRNALYKRAMNYDILPSLSTDSEGLLNLNEFGAETDQFVSQRLDPYLENKWNDFSEKVGDYANDPAAQALWIATTSQWRNNMVDNYNKRVVDFNLDSQKQELGLQIEAMGQRGVDEVGNQLVPDFSTLPDILTNRDKLLADDGVSPKDRTDLMATEITAQATALLGAGRVKDAELLVSLAEATKINGQPVFRTGSSAKQFADLKMRFDKADTEEDERSAADIRRTFSGQALVVYENLNALENIGELDDFTRQTVINTFEALNPEITDEEIEANLVAIFNHPVSSSEGFDQALQQIALSSGDFGNSLYFDTKAAINRERTALQQRTVITSSLTAADKQDNLTEFEAWKRDNPQKSAKQWIISQGLNIPLFKELRDKDTELSQGNWVFNNQYYKNADDTLATQAKLVETQVTVGLESDETQVLRSSINIISTQLEPQLLRDTQEYARSLDPTLSVEERDDKIRDFVNTEAAKASERMRDFAEAFKKRGFVTEEATPQQRAKLEAAKPRADKIYYTHLTRGQARFKPEFIAKERETMRVNRHYPQLGLSLITRGYDKWDPEAWKLLDDVDLGAQDVRLFGSEGELDSVTAEWSEVVSKELALEELTEEEEAIKDMFQDFGIYNLNTLNTFIEEQRFLLQDTD